MSQDSQSNKPQRKPLEPLLIRRQEVKQGLVAASVLALLIASCTPRKEDSGSNPATEQIQAVFYETVQDCEADITKQQEEYKVLLDAYEKQELSQAPVAPEIKPEDCAAQMEVARQAHENNAPVYETRVDCEAEGVRCENTPSGYHTTGYRPVFGGSYFYPYGGYSSFTYINLGGRTHRVYEPRPVYRSSTPNQVVTPNGRTVNRSTIGRTSVPRYTTQPAPKRPTGTAARGTIKGRSSRGFGSTYRSTGRGGK